ncbi:hypothetical protein [Pontibacillus litoralis]|uniref:Lipoprotein n=1 Tax=Pontibacillus litoralis JSM 072002 TaxID=1385512 RepID=A0A0A5G638_9BACI|nr:hypothetical protein [Pontibacillus litoralis]KGX86638.1 hypothetical protein N784_04245 [Pontibacillus litoralis JSM 072002]
MKKLAFIIIGILFLTACNAEERTRETKLTIEPLQLTEREEKLVKQQPAELQEYFLVNGMLNESDDLKLAVTKIEDGEQTEKMSSYGFLETEYDDYILSTSIYNHSNTEETLVFGSDTSLSSSTIPIPTEFNSFTYGSIISEETSLEKGETYHLAYLQGSSENSMSTPSITPTELKDMKNAELAYIFTISIIDKDHHQR